MLIGKEARNPRKSRHDHKQMYTARPDLRRPYMVTKGKNFRLKSFDPGDTGELDNEDKPGRREACSSASGSRGIAGHALRAGPWSVLLIFQGDVTRRERTGPSKTSSPASIPGLRGLLVQGATSEDLDHDYLWRCMKRLPERGRIGIFNRSYYEETLVVRVHRNCSRKRSCPRSA